MNQRYILLWVAFWAAPCLLAQDRPNLVNNGSFEELLHLGAVNNLVRNWVHISHFHQSKQMKQQVFQLFPEDKTPPKKAAKNGNALYKAELYAHPVREEDNKNHRTIYYQSILNESLVKDQHYEVIFHVAKSEDIELLLPQIGVYLSESPLGNFQKQIYELQPQLLFHLDRVNQSNDWQEMKATFTAKGKEKYITIGFFGKPNFKPEIVKKTDGDTFRALYYLDDVKVSQVEQNILLSHLDSGSVYALNSSILFEVGKYEILPKATESLDAIGNVLRQNPKIVLEIAGHTDNTGSENENLLLSQKRAESVRNFLINSGIDAKRLSAKGYGSQRPIAENNSPKGKEQNRRVEFLVEKAK